MNVASFSGDRYVVEARTAKYAGEPAPAPDEGFYRACLTAIVQRDEAALSQFYDATVSRVYAVAMAILRQPELAEEVATDVFFQVWNEADRYDPSRGRVLGWLLIMARTRALDCLRKQDKAFSHPDPQVLIGDHAGENDVLDMFVAARDSAALQKAILKLSPLQRQLLSLAFFRGLTHAEIAATSGMPLGSVKSHMRRTLSLLREVLELADDPPKEV